jgi:hypothetical protein
VIPTPRTPAVNEYARGEGFVPTSKNGRSDCKAKQWSTISKGVIGRRSRKTRNQAGQENISLKDDLLLDEAMHTGRACW